MYPKDIFSMLHADYHAAYLHPQWRLVPGWLCHPAMPLIACVFKSNRFIHHLWNGPTTVVIVGW